MHRFPIAPRAEALERRVLLAVFTVTTTADDGPGSLRRAMADAEASPNANQSPDSIVFNIPGAGVQTIRPLSPLPHLTHAVLLDGTTQPGYPRGVFTRVTPALVELDGSGAGPDADGIVITGQLVTVKGLAINRFSRHGVRVEGNSYGSKVLQCLIGTDPTGNLALGNGGAGVMTTTAIDVLGGGGRGEGNLISGNHGPGVWLTYAAGGSGATIRVANNNIGTNVDGNRPLGNGGEGVLVEDGQIVQITSNVISGNGASGVRVAGDRPFNLLIEANWIGTDPTAAFPIPNGTSPRVLYNNGVTLVGTTSADVKFNRIGGNAGAGVFAAGGSDLLVQGNFVGVSGTGGQPLSNGGDGIVVDSLRGAQVLGNLVSANRGDGIRVANCTPSSAGNKIGGNYVGVDRLGGFALGNGGNGIVLDNSQGFMIGGEPYVPPPRPLAFLYSPDATGQNLVSGNGGHGIVLTGPRATNNNRVQGDYVGTDASGSRAVGNLGSGIYLAASSITVGGAGTLQNVISGNGGDGITVAPYAPGGVVAHRVFYNDSAADGWTPGAAAADDAAIAADKRPLFPGEAPFPANYTTYSRGINGVMIDVANLPAEAVLTAADFAFRSLDGAVDAAWRDGPLPSGITVRRGAGQGGSARVTLVWGDHDPTSPTATAVANGWLEVRVKANANTALPRDDVFYFGNLVGDVGTDLPEPLTAAPVVDALDLANVRNFQLSTDPRWLARLDFNRDGRINAVDVAIVRANQLRSLTPLRTPATPPPAALGALAGPTHDRTKGSPARSVLLA